MLRRSHLQGLVVALAFWLTFPLLSVLVRGQVNTKQAADPSPDNSELDIGVNNVQLLLIAPDGRKTGYDPSGGSDYQGIPDSVYNQDALEADDGSGEVDPDTTESLDVRQPIAGLYELMVYGKKHSEKYKVEINFFLPKTGEADAVLTGNTTPGSPVIYDFELNAGLGSKIVAARVDQPTVHSTFGPEVERWPSLKSAYGWEISYPEDWSSSGGGKFSLGDFMGPGRCNYATNACAHVDFGSQAAGPGDVSAQAFLLGQRYYQEKIVRQSEIEVGGQRGYQVVVVPFSQTWMPPDRRAYSIIAVKRGGQISKITYSETGPQFRGIRLPAEWKFEATFEKILSTVTFYK